MAFISISVDICNSTRIKQDIVRLSCNDAVNIRKMYEEFVRNIACIEIDQYISMIDEGLDQGNIYVIKAIGDEIWSLYDISDVETGSLMLNDIVSGLLKAGEAISRRQHYITISSRELTDEENMQDGLPDDLVTQTYRVVPKIYIDLVEEYTDYTSIRNQFFMDRVDHISHTSADDSQVMGNAFDSFAGRFVFGLTDQEQTLRNQLHYRPDPVGYEVDRFFRCAKAAVPGFVCMGEKLFSALRLSSHNITVPLAEGDRREVEIPVGRKAKGGNCYVHLQKVQQDLKGVFGDYTIYYLHSKEKFNQMVKSWMAEPEIYQGTLELLIKKRALGGIYRHHT